MRSVWITSTTDTINSIRAIDAVVYFFPGIFCICVIVYILYVALCVYVAVVCIQCGCIYRIFFCFDGLIIQSTHIVHHTHHIVNIFHSSILILIYLR